MMHYTCTLFAFFRYLCDHLRCYHGDDPIQRIPHLRDLVSADESCDEAVELAELLLQQGTQKIVVFRPPSSEQSEATLQFE